MNMLARNDGSWGSRELRNLNSMMDLFMREMGMKHPGWLDDNWESSIQVTLNDKSVTATLSCPGCRNEDMEVEVVGDMLNVNIKHASREDHTHEEGKKHYITRERSCREFSESIRMPVPVKGQEAKAKYIDGVLTIEIPRMDAPEKKYHSVRVEG